MLDSAKVGRVVIDGVASSPQWANSAPDLMLYDWLNSTESTYGWFLRDCAAAGPDACALAHASDKDADGREIERRLEHYLDGLWETPRIVITPDGNVGILHSSVARGEPLASWLSSYGTDSTMPPTSAPLPVYQWPSLMAGHRLAVRQGDI